MAHIGRVALPLCAKLIREGFVAGESGGNCPTPDQGRGSSMKSRAERPSKEGLFQGASGVSQMKGRVEQRIEVTLLGRRSGTRSEKALSARLGIKSEDKDKQGVMQSCTQESKTSECYAAGIGGPEERSARGDGKAHGGAKGRAERGSSHGVRIGGRFKDCRPGGPDDWHVGVSPRGE